MTLPNDPFKLKVATVGKPLPHIEIKIINPATGEVVPVGERGELLLLAIGGCYCNDLFREADILTLIEHTDCVAEIPNSLKLGTPVTLATAQAISKQGQASLNKA